MSTMRALLDSGVPLVAVSFYDNDCARTAKEAKAAGVDVAELRVDQFERTDVEHVLACAAEFGDLATLATVRSRREGGEWGGSEQQRLELFRALAPHVDAVDVELSSREIRDDVIAEARRHDAVVIASYHDFERTPELDRLRAVVAEAGEVGADLVKVSTMANSREDVRRLATLLTNAPEDLGMIVIGMGATGTLSRVFFPALGSRLTYSFIGDRPTSGQLEFGETSRLLRQFYPDFDRRRTGG
ncbi:3-dehydroquinate dehydratase-1 [Saccharothrix coeruleofusca]|uniref:type I 3-dehydroquinate dehydratase n=1 Tax=Saccharothrix coeruleofusca TaxID=33919 RepID=UPI001AEA82C5|nr:type I 3-dehydroquinate dehydratase [Saccharothrix coeruleofusca]MBP2333981.1 3-dehydroquinate dehydratase-1 [Saccharothrix coeruleofusca]